MRGLQRSPPLVDLVAKMVGFNFLAVVTAITAFCFQTSLSIPTAQGKVAPFEDGSTSTLVSLNTQMLTLHRAKLTTLSSSPRNEIQTHKRQCQPSSLPLCLLNQVNTAQLPTVHSPGRNNRFPAPSLPLQRHKHQSHPDRSLDRHPALRYRDSKPRVARRLLALLPLVPPPTLLRGPAMDLRPPRGNGFGARAGAGVL